MAVLLALADLKLHLGIPAADETDDVLLTAELAEAIAFFERDVGRADRPYADAGEDRTEVHDGMGAPDCYLDYPISAITSITLGQDSSDPDETLDPTDIDEVTFAVGGRLLTRTDGGHFGPAGLARYITVVYDHQADLPDAVKPAILRFAALLYRQRGSEDATDEREGGFSHTLARAIEDDPLWQRARATEVLL